MERDGLSSSHPQAIVNSTMDEESEYGDGVFRTGNSLHLFAIICS